MFGRIAGRYDLLNRVLSAGIDQAWRRATVRAAGDVTGMHGIDLCCGTGDLAIAFEKAGAKVAGLDFTPEMLPIARRKGDKRPGDLFFGQADALQVPARTDSADFCSVAFGIRNVENRTLCLLHQGPARGWQTDLQGRRRLQLSAPYGYGLARSRHLSG
jgi:demethylmenaquinone methyltransferase/2-methoxy-6-polyprenyl-1,4-benzoquinol methylase